MEQARPRVVIVGAGFGGLQAARKLRSSPVDVTLIDRHNYHVFVPLLYQVATAGLEPEEVAQPVRRILRGAANTRFVLADVNAIDLDARKVATSAGTIEYDYLVFAPGSAPNYFGLESVAQTAAVLRDLDDSEALRDRILRAFESASAEPDRQRQQELMTVVIVGGGPTGVELAGALAELKRHVLPRDYPTLDLSLAQVVLVEATDHLLPGMPVRLQAKAKAKLQDLGVDVRTQSIVAGADSSGVTLRSGEKIVAATVVWVAGLRAVALAESLPTPRDDASRLIVRDTLQLPGHSDAYAIGDVAHVGTSETKPHPMLAPVAIQQGTLAAKNILRQVAGKQPAPFTYKDRGTMATIGRQAAVADVYGLQVNGFIAWLLWLGLHLVWLIGFRNRTLVLVNWAWNYLTYDRAVRLIRR